MRCPGIFLFLAVIACIFIAGCTQSSGTSPVTTVVTVPSPTPSLTATPAPAAAETADPAAAATCPVVTIVHQISLIKDVKDSEHLFSLQVPVEWSVSSYRLENPENFEGFMYQTDLVANNTFYIHTFSNYRSREQNYRDECLRWSPAPSMTTVKINGLTFDRFESTANGKTNVTYVPHKSNVNEFGYLSVLAFSADTSNRFAVEDYDKVVASFRSYGKDVVSTMPGQEITRILPDAQEGGSARSAFRSSVSGSAGISAPSSCRRSG